MPSDKPRITLYLDKQDMECLGVWANREFLTVPQLTRVVVKRAIAEYLKQHSFDVPTPSPQQTETTPSPATKAKRGNKKKTTAP
jgi:hypothetical protein